MILNGEVRHYLAVKKLSALLRGITSKQHGNFYCLNYLYSFPIKKNLNLRRNYVYRDKKLHEQFFSIVKVNTKWG